uniref:RecA family profile 2 domain-containing protein n=1 Tax=Aegilops tauschii subsp. strangulata TaxID=200361 RepID=A0A453GLS8_AEGTS
SADMQSDYESDPPLDDEKSLEKVSTLNGAVSQLASDFDRDSNLCLERFSRTRRASVISTGSLKLDLALGIGGLPKGRMVEIFGKESSGKTTLALHVIKEAQKNGGYCAYIDAENAFNTSFAEEIGVDIDKLLIAQPDSAENSLSIVNTLVGGSIDVVVVDSVRTKRSSDASSGIYKEVTCGGNALGFYSAIRMRTSRRKLHYSEDEATGISIAVQIIKNKLVPACLKEAGLNIGFGKGICHESEILEMASTHGVIVKEGSGYWINGDFLPGKEEAEKFLLENDAVADDICSTMRSQLFET